MQPQIRLRRRPHTRNRTTTLRSQVHHLPARGHHLSARRHVWQEQGDSQRPLGIVRRSPHAAARREVAQVEKGVRFVESDRPPRHYPHRCSAACAHRRATSRLRSDSPAFHRRFLPRLPFCHHHRRRRGGRCAVSSHRKSDSRRRLASRLPPRCDKRREHSTTCGRGTHASRLHERRKRPPHADPHGQGDHPAETFHRSHVAACHGNGGAHGRQRGAARCPQRKRDRAPLHSCGHHPNAVSPRLHSSSQQESRSDPDRRGTHRGDQRRTAQKRRTHRAMGE